MGQSISGERFLSLFSWSTVSTPRSRSRDKCRNCDDSQCESRNIQQSKNFNSFSCFKTQNAGNENKDKYLYENVDISGLDDNTHKRRNSLPEIHTCRKIKKPDNAMPLSKKCYNFCDSDENEEQKDQHQNCNYSCVKRYDIPQQSCEREGAAEINGNQIESVQSCSSDQASGTNSTSINRYISAFNQSVEKLSLDDDIYNGSNCPKTSLKLKRPHKGKSSRECNSCAKESKANGKSGTKKKNAWGMKIYGSKLNKGNNSKTLTGGAGPSSLDTETGCVCTSYKKVEFNEPTGCTDIVPVEPPRPQQQLSLGWASERINMPRNISTVWTSRGSGIYSQQNRVGERVTGEGTHCRVDVEFSNIVGLPINIAVARVAPTPNPITGVVPPVENNLILFSLNTQHNPVFDLTSRLNSDEHVLEDCEERARVMRALEIAEGVEPPPGYNSPHIQVVSPIELRALLFQQQPSTSLCNHQLHHHARIHTQVDYIHCLVPDLRSITSCSFYWGKMDRYEAERLLEGKDEGTFLLRDSAQEEYLFSVSFRKYQRSLHARIEQFNHKFSFDSHDPGVFASDTVTGLIEHYKDPSCVMFFEPMLTAPLSRTFTFPLQHLCRAVIVSCTTYDGINKLRLPAGIKTYLKEYHYRQRVRVKRFDESPDVTDEIQ